MAIRLCSIVCFPRHRIHPIILDHLNCTLCLLYLPVCRHIYWIFACWFAGSLVVYFLFSLPMSYIRHEKLDYVQSEQLRYVA